MDSLKRGDAIVRPCQTADNKEALFDVLPSISRAHLKAAHTHAQPPAQGRKEGVPAILNRELHKEVSGGQNWLT